MNTAETWSSKAFEDEHDEGNSSTNGEGTIDVNGVDVAMDANHCILKHRRRSLSVATAQPSVETVVVKAKRAASSLWMLLHAQNCVLAGKCHHAGCQEAKLMHLHLKTCPSGVNGVASCPTRYHGCDQARKLMEHYRRCKNLRSRCQAGCRREIAQQQQQHCLICSFVARQARTVLEGGSKGSCFSASSVSPMARKQSPKHSVSFVVSVRDSSVADDLIRTPSTAAPSNIVKMPPPPPRQLMVGNIYSNSSSSESPSCLQVLPVPSKTPFSTLEPTVIPEEKPATASEEEPTLLSEPDAASILCSLVGIRNISKPQQQHPSVSSLVMHRRDRSVSNAESVNAVFSSSSLPYQYQRRPRSASVGCSLDNKNHVSISHGHYSSVQIPRSEVPANHRSIETIQEEERSHHLSQQSRDLAAELEFTSSS